MTNNIQTTTNAQIEANAQITANAQTTTNAQFPHNQSRLPSREELHRYPSNLISLADFDTTRPTGHAIDKTANAIRWIPSGMSYFRK